MAWSAALSPLAVFGQWKRGGVVCSLRRGLCKSPALSCALMWCSVEPIWSSRAATCKKTLPSTCPLSWKPGTHLPAPFQYMVTWLLRGGEGIFLEPMWWAHLAAGFVLESSDPSTFLQRYQLIDLKQGRCGEKMLLLTSVVEGQHSIGHSSSFQNIKVYLSIM